MQTRTDLAMESQDFSKRIQGVAYHAYQHDDFEEIHVYVETEQAAQALSKSCGRYITLSCPKLPQIDGVFQLRLARSLAGILNEMLPSEGELLIVGLGNRQITADALGSRVLDHLLITRHMRSVDELHKKSGIRSVCAIAPGVLGVTGIETAEVVQGIVERIHPAAVIAIDALAARETGRICTTIQMTDTGIRPGSGVGNHRRGLTKETLGVPVCAIGVPMVVYASVIARDALNMMLQDIGMDAQQHGEAVNAMVQQVTEKGMGDLVVTPREVDQLVGKVAQIIAMGLNIALHPGLSEEDIHVFLHD